MSFVSIYFNLLHVRATTQPWGLCRRKSQLLIHTTKNERKHEKAFKISSPAKLQRRKLWVFQGCFISSTRWHGCKYLMSTQQCVLHGPSLSFSLSMFPLDFALLHRKKQVALRWRNDTDREAHCACAAPQRGILEYKGLVLLKWPSGQLVICKK